jgi:REP element-mobilizing transposase RayT
MARQLRIEYPGAFYHVTSRGNRKQPIFLQDDDRRYFLSRLDEAHEKKDAVIHAYCLMENHYHLILETPRGNLSRIMHSINTAYTIYFNGCHSRCGHLFQGRFKAILVDAQTYMQELSRYIHLNPVIAGIVASPERYPWSSYRDLLGLREPPRWLQGTFILRFFGGHPDAARKRFAEFIVEGMKQPIQDPTLKADPSSILGSEGFVARIKRTCLADKAVDFEVPDLRRLRLRPELRRIQSEAEKMLGPKNRFSRNLAIFLSHKCTDFTLKEIGDHFGLSTSSISQICGRMKTDVSWNGVLAMAVDEIESKL